LGKNSINQRQKQGNTTKYLKLKQKNEYIYKNQLFFKSQRGSENKKHHCFIVLLRFNFQYFEEI